MQYLIANAWMRCPKHKPEYYEISKIKISQKLIESYIRARKLNIDDINLLEDAIIKATTTKNELSRIDLANLTNINDNLLNYLKNLSEILGYIEQFLMKYVDICIVWEYISDKYGYTNPFKEFYPYEEYIYNDNMDNIYQQFKNILEFDLFVSINSIV